MGRPVEVIERWWAMFEAGDLDGLVAMTTVDADIVMPGGMRFTGPAELRPMLEAYRTAFPTMRHQVVSAVEDGNVAAVEVRVDVEHSGEFVTPMGSIPASGKRFVIESCDVVRVADDGRIASWHTYLDMATMMANMGAAAPT